jgi:hypothetical protein
LHTHSRRGRGRSTCWTSCRPSTEDCAGSGLIRATHMHARLAHTHTHKGGSSGEARGLAWRTTESGSGSVRRLLPFGFAVVVLCAGRGHAPHPASKANIIGRMQRLYISTSHLGLSTTAGLILLMLALAFALALALALAPGSSSPSCTVTPTRKSSANMMSEDRSPRQPLALAPAPRSRTHPVSFLRSGQK